MSPTIPKPPSPVIAGATLRAATPADCSAVARLSASQASRYCHGLDALTTEHSQGLLSALGATMWATPMLVECEAEIVAFIALVNVDPRDLTADLVALLADEPDNTDRRSVPLAIGDIVVSALQRYVEMVFWAYPLERLSCRVLHPGGPYAHLLAEAGFVSEGVLTGLARRGAVRVDVEYRSVLRELPRSVCE